MYIINGQHLGIRFMDNTRGCHPWIHPWMLSVDAIQRYYPWILPLSCPWVSMGLLWVSVGRILKPIGPRGTPWASWDPTAARDPTHRIFLLKPFRKHIFQNLSANIERSASIKALNETYNRSANRQHTCKTFPHT